MPLIAISSSAVTHECATCSTRRETQIDALRLGSPRPDCIVLPSCDCGAFETLRVTSTPSEDLALSARDAVTHEHMVRALGVLLEEGKYTAAEFVHQEPLSAEVTARIVRGGKKRRSGGAE